MLLCVHQLAAVCVCLLLGAAQVVYRWCTAASAPREGWMRAVRENRQGDCGSGIVPRHHEVLYFGALRHPFPPRGELFFPYPASGLLPVSIPDV